MALNKLLANVKYEDRMIKNYMGKEFKSISDAVEAHIDGSDYDTGEIETIRTEVNNLTMCVGNLVEILVEKNMLTEKDVEEVVLRGLFA